PAPEPVGPQPDASDDDQEAQQARQAYLDAMRGAHEPGGALLAREQPANSVVPLEAPVRLIRSPWTKFQAKWMPTGSHRSPLRN
ncbi:MAG: hypothetical protein KGY78_11660, partial [Anaerolineae bacterium]|nr:hypothetical protein [Anaerolineae bacterium]